MSASDGANRSRRGVGEVEPEYGRPILSRMVATSLAGISWRMVGVDVVAERGRFFDAGASAGADVNLEWPESTEGKKSWPSQGARRRRKRRKSRRRRRGRRRRDPRRG